MYTGNVHIYINTMGSVCFNDNGLDDALREGLLIDTEQMCIYGGRGQGDSQSN